AFALARARLSMLNTNRYFSEYQDPARKQKAREEAEAAVRLAPTLAEGHLALGYHYFSSARNYDAALEELSTAEKSSPNNPDVWRWRAIIYRRQGRWRQAVANFQRAENLDP